MRTSRYSVLLLLLATLLSETACTRTPYIVCECTAVRRCTRKTHDGSPRPIIAVYLLGMDIAPHEEYGTSHKIALGRYDHLPMEFDWEVKNREHESAAPFYELAKVVDRLAQEFGLPDEKVRIYFGRGTFGNHPQRSLETKLAQYTNELGGDPFIVVVGKSFGGTDAIRAMQDLCDDKKLCGSIGNVDLLVLVDATAPTNIVGKVAFAEKLEDEDLLVYPIPPVVQRAYNAVQRVDDPPFQGHLINGTGQEHVSNEVLEPKEFNGRYSYSGYVGEEPVPLTVKHSHMDELVFVAPVFRYGGKRINLHDLIYEEYKTNHPPFLRCPELD
jgi:hypothetical protein